MNWCGKYEDRTILQRCCPDVDARQHHGPRPDAWNQSGVKNRHFQVVRIRTLQRWLNKFSTKGLFSIFLAVSIQAKRACSIPRQTDLWCSMMLCPFCSAFSLDLISKGPFWAQGAALDLSLSCRVSNLPTLARSRRNATCHSALFTQTSSVSSRFKQMSSRFS